MSINNHHHEEIEDDWSDTQSIDSCEAYINFQSIRDPSTQLEEAVTFSWPGIYQDSSDGSSSSMMEQSRQQQQQQQEDNEQDSRQLRKITISTLLEEDDLAPLFGGCQWAGTRLWGAAVRAIQFLAGHLNLEIDEQYKDISSKLVGMNHGSNDNHTTTLLELGCGLGVPGMIYHMLGSNVVLTDQEDILAQLVKNVEDNFPSTAMTSSSSSSSDSNQHYIRAMPLSWSRTDVQSLLEEVQLSTAGFDIVLNCDCVFEPLYGNSWHLLNETIDELLRVNPKCIVVSSMERRGPADGIDKFIDEMKEMEYVGSVDKVYFEEKRNIEIYVTRGLE